MSRRKDDDDEKKKPFLSCSESWKCEFWSSKEKLTFESWRSDLWNCRKGLYLRTALHELDVFTYYLNKGAKKSVKTVEWFEREAASHRKLMNLCWRVVIQCTRAPRWTNRRLLISPSCLIQPWFPFLSLFSSLTWSYFCFETKRVYYSK